jgi:hypothetical protein
MKKFIAATAFLVLVSGLNAVAQENKSSETYGHTLNAGVGIGYYGYINNVLPVVHADFEFEIARNFTLAPFITIFSYSSYYYWGNPNYPYRNYSYRQTVIPVGVKGTYYFDQFLGAGPKWDFYLAGSLGFAIRKTTWENGYTGETTIAHGSSGVYFDGHIGTEYHFNERLGMFLDLSSGISTLGLGFHL